MHDLNFPFWFSVVAYPDSRGIPTKKLIPLSIVVAGGWKIPAQLDLITEKAPELSIQDYQLDILN